jgi:hypothetical protein
VAERQIDKGVSLSARELDKGLCDRQRSVLV